MESPKEKLVKKMLALAHAKEPRDWTGMVLNALERAALFFFGFGCGGLAWHLLHG